MRAGSGPPVHDDRVARREVAELAAVEGEHDRPVVAHGEAQGLLGREHERTVEQHVRRHRREQQATQTRRDDRPTRRERVRGGTGGRGDDHTVGRVRREGRAVHVDLEPDQPPRVHLLEHRFVEPEPAAARRALRHDVDREHHALGDLVVAGEQAVERGVEVVGLDLGEVAELADVHPEHGNAGFVGEVDGAEHRAVTAERDHDVEPLGEVLEVDREVREPGAVGVGTGHAHLDAVLGETVGGVLGQLDRGRPVRVRDEPDAARGHRRAPGCATASSTAASSTPSSTSTPCARQWKRNSTLPSAPRSGDTIAPTVTRPWPARPSRTSREDGPVHLGVAHHPALADPGAARPRTAASPRSR